MSDLSLSPLLELETSIAPLPDLLRLPANAWKMRHPQTIYERYYSTT